MIMPAMIVIITVIMTTAMSTATMIMVNDYDSFDNDDCSDDDNSVDDDDDDELVSWCFEPSQPQRITSGLKTNFSLSPSYSLNRL